MLARRPAAKVWPGHQERGPSILGTIEDEVSLLPPVVKKERPISRALNPFQKLLGDDLIGIDVAAVEWGDDTGDAGKRFH